MTLTAGTSLTVPTASSASTGSMLTTDRPAMTNTAQTTTIDEMASTSRNNRGNAASPTGDDDCIYSSEENKVLYTGMMRTSLSHAASDIHVGTYLLVP